MTVPYTFATASSPLPLSQLDANFAAVGQSSNLSYTYSSANAVTRTASSKMSDFASVIDFGATGDGVTDDTNSIQSALNSSGSNSLYFPSGTYLISSALSIPSNKKLYGDQQTIIKLATANISLFSSVNKSNIFIYNMQFLQTVTGTSAYVAGVSLDTCEKVKIENCTFTGMQWAGVWLKDTNNSVVLNNRFLSFTGTVQDSADICVYQNSSYNIISNNYCYGGNYHGILVQDPYSSSSPIKNVISGNIVGQHKAYGICLYQPNSINTYTQIIGNQVENILGSVLSNDSGAGIYVAGAGGVIINGNSVRNCCQQTATRALAPAGIGINGINVGIDPAIISNNEISNVSHYDGINISSSTAGAVISGNQITVVSGNVTGAPVYIINSSNITIDGNSITQNDFISPSASCILVYAYSANINNIIINSNNIYGSNYGQIQIDKNSSYTINNVVISGNNLNGASSSCYPMRLSSITKCVVTNNIVIADTQSALLQSNSTTVRYSNNTFFTTGTNPLTFSGTNTASYFDKTNYQYNYLGSIYYPLNQGTGLIIEQLGSSSPSTGTWAVGDTIVQSSPAVGQPKGWVCTVAGSPGTWVSVGNL